MIERCCVEDVACRVIAANRSPDHTTIARFRARHQQALSRLFFEVLALCRDAGMVSVGVVAVDSTKLAADASLGANRTLDGLRAEAERIVGEAADIDAREDELFGERRGDELPEELADPSMRAARIRELLAAADSRAEEIEAEHGELRARYDEQVARTGKRSEGRPPERGLPVKARRELASKKHDLTDPDSGIVRHRGMLMQGYNVQTAVGEGQIILATEVTDVSPDSGQLEPTLAEAERTLARLNIEDQIEQVLADGGYCDGRQIKQLKQRGVKVLIPPAERKRRGKLTSPEVFEMQC